MLSREQVFCKVALSVCLDLSSPLPFVFLRPIDPLADTLMKQASSGTADQQQQDDSTNEEMKLEREDDPKLVAAIDVMEKGNKSVGDFCLCETSPYFQINHGFHPQGAFKSACGQISKLLKAVQKKPAEEKRRKIPMAVCLLSLFEFLLEFNLQICYDFMFMA